MSFSIKGNIRVNKWKVKPKVVAQALASDPGINATLLGIGQTVVDNAKKRAANASKPPNIKYEKWPPSNPVYWSADPAAVAKMIQLKTSAPIKGFDTAKGLATEVVLITADHAYSLTYEFGHDEFPAVRFMTGALDAVDRMYGKRVKRRSATGVAIP